jgi:hypothetical protein
MSHVIAVAKEVVPMGDAQFRHERAVGGAMPTVRVFVPAEVAYDLEKTQRVIATVLGRLGCQACCSGFDIRLIQELDFAVDPKNLEVSPARL